MSSLLSDALAADANNQIGSDVAEHFDSLRSWIIDRIDEVGQEVDLTQTGVPAAIGAAILEQNRPNPFNPATEIFFRLDRQTQVNVRIFDVTGRLVRELLSDVELSIGQHQVRWDGRHRSGLTVAAGTYFYQLVADGNTRTRCMTLVK